MHEMDLTNAQRRAYGQVVLATVRELVPILGKGAARAALVIGRHPGPQFDAHALGAYLAAVSESTHIERDGMTPSRFAEIMIDAVKSAQDATQEPPRRG